MKIQGRVAIVTGASSGIGRAVAVDLARRGASVVAVARREAELEATADACRRPSPDSFAEVADVARAGDCQKVVDAAVRRLGRVDVLVNNAGISMHKDVRQTSPADVERVMSVNFLGAVTMTSLVLAGMVERREGWIVNVTSVAGQIPSPKEAAYGASKAALHMWTHGLNVDLAGTGVHAGVLSPGPIDTEIWGKDETPSSYQGRKYPAELVAGQLARMVERDLVQRTVPRLYGVFGPLYALPVTGRLLRWGLVEFEMAGQRRGKVRDPSAT
ncbi:MAG TPA: SDR family oxidoreductase [Acidimicrobiales bacterium]